MPSKQPSAKSERDYTKYTFAGETTGKGRLVLALVKRFASDQPSATFDDLRTAFPDRLQADSTIQFDRVQCVVRRLVDVPGKSLRRFFAKEDELIQLPDGATVVSREWNIENIQNVLALAEQLEYEVTIHPRAQVVVRQKRRNRERRKRAQARQ